MVGFTALAAMIGLSLLTVACAPSSPGPAPVIDRSGALGGEARPAARRPATAPGTAAARLPEARGRIIRTEQQRITIRAGDTLYGLSRQHQVPLRALIDANRLAPPYRLIPGQSLQIPVVRVYEVARGDTVFAIARSFDLSPGAIIRENALQPPDFVLVPGQRLVLPWTEADTVARASPPSQATPPPPPASQPRPVALPAPSRTPQAVTTPPPARAESRFLWPVQGEILSGFGPQGTGLFNDGINIASATGAPVRAAENGVVVYAGNELAGYGNLLLIRHADGWISAYAHNDALLVQRGDTVTRGQVVARVGQTGNVNRPQLHFELRQGRRAVDPVPHLGAMG